MTIRTKTISGASKLLENEDVGVNMPVGGRKTFWQLNDAGYTLDGPVPYDVELQPLKEITLKPGEIYHFTVENSNAARVGIKLGTPPSGST